MSVLVSRVVLASRMKVVLMAWGSDVYSMALSNEPAEELANMLVEQSNGVFELCGFFAGGKCIASSLSIFGLLI